MKNLNKLAIILLLILSLAGCATLPIPNLVDITRETGREKVFDYSYKKIFYASEDAITNMPTTWHIEESSFEEGYIFANHAGETGIAKAKAMIVVEKVDKDKISVKIKPFRDIFFKSFYKLFFENVERFASRKE